MHIQVFDNWFDQMCNKGNERVAYEELSEDVKDHDPIARGDLLAVRCRFRGTNSGPFPGNPPTYNQGVMTGIVIYRFDGPWVVEVWEGRNMFELAQQLGLVET